jgi:SAM-dependent methyltransferase
MFAFLKGRRAVATSRNAAPAPVNDTADLINVKDLIARYSNAEHIARADAYFGTIPDDAMLLRKPFFGIPDTQANMHGVAEVLQRLKLFPGARVLDFGAGTGWFSRMLAFLECQAIAVDVSAKALGLGQRAFERDPVAAGLSVEWRTFDGLSLPAEDASVDRIVCYDSFHHVADQEAVLREFYRVLASGGRVVFHEPGPNHSTIPISQYEMRHHDVIENDIVIEDIWGLASAAGFSNLELALTTPRTLSVPLHRYSRIIAGEAAAGDIAAILGCIAEGAANLRIFSISKGEEILDSRQTAGLAGAFDVTLTDTAGDVLRGRARVTNTGSTPWRPSVGGVGGVWLGVRVPDNAAQPDFGRVWLSDAPILPGQTVEVDFSLDAPPGRPIRIMFDLVAESVTWFEPIGSKPVDFQLD